MVIALASVVIGFVLGLRFRVFVLLPTIAAGLFMIVGLELGRDLDAGRAIFLVIVFAVCLQTGYLIGVLCRRDSVTSGAQRIRERFRLGYRAVGEDVSKNHFKKSKK